MSAFWVFVDCTYIIPLHFLSYSFDNDIFISLNLLISYIQSSFYSTYIYATQNPLMEANIYN